MFRVWLAFFEVVLTWSFHVTLLLRWTWLMWQLLRPGCEVYIVPGFWCVRWRESDKVEADLSHTHRQWHRIAWLKLASKCQTAYAVASAGVKLNIGVNCAVSFFNLIHNYFAANHHFYSAPQCSHCKRCTSYGNSVRLSAVTVQFALSDSKMCLVL